MLVVFENYENGWLKGSKVNGKLGYFQEKYAILFTCDDSSSEYKDRIKVVSLSSLMQKKSFILI